jgi:hypothetical protein
MMPMTEHQQSPQILDSSKTAMARLCSNLLNNCGKTATALLTHQQSPSIWQHNILNSGNDGALEILSNS